MKHDVIQISPKIEEMKKMIEEMVVEVDKHDQSIAVNEELYNKLEMKDFSSLSTSSLNFFLTFISSLL